MSLDPETAAVVGGSAAGMWVLKTLGSWAVSYFMSRTESIDQLRAQVTSMMEKQDVMIKKFDEYTKASHNHDRELDVVKSEIVTIKTDLAGLVAEKAKRARR